MIKRILLILLVATVISCQQQPKAPLPILTYAVGDIVYLKPDSVKGYIFSVNKDYQYYKVSYFDKLGKEDVTYIQELQIYGK